MTILSHKPYLVKVTTKGGGGQKYPKFWPRCLWMTPNYHKVWNRVRHTLFKFLIFTDFIRVRLQFLIFLAPQLTSAEAICFVEVGMFCGFLWALIMFVFDGVLGLTIGSRCILCPSTSHYTVKNQNLHTYLASYKTIVLNLHFYVYTLGIANLAMSNILLMRIGSQILCHIAQIIEFRKTLT